MSLTKQNARLMERQDRIDSRRALADIRKKSQDPDFIRDCQREWDAEDGRPIQQQVRDDLNNPAIKARADAEWDAMVRDDYERECG